jgi:hypothetical protein
MTAPDASMLGARAWTGSTVVSERWVSRPAHLLRTRAVLLGVYFAITVVTRLWWIDLVVTADEGYWMQRTIRFGAALARGDFDQTYRIGHPGVTVIWIGLAGVGAERLGA